jgi:hypothetical protein
MKINFTIEKIDNGRAILTDDKQRKIEWPADLLPAETKAGELISFNIGAEENLAKSILNEIIG